MSVSLSTCMMVAALVSCAEGAHMGESPLPPPPPPPPPKPPPPGCDQELSAMQNAATAATSAAAAQGITLHGGGCDQPASQMLSAAAAKAEKLLCGKQELPEPPPDETKDELSVMQDQIMCAKEPPKATCAPPAPSALAQKAKAAGEKAQKISEAYQQAEMDAKKSAEATQVKKHKADLMKAVVVKAYGKAALEAAELAKQKVGLASATAQAVKVCEGAEHETASTGDDAAQAEKEMEEAEKEQKTTMEASQASSDNKAAADCQAKAAIEASQALACEGNTLIEKIDSNLATPKATP